jgi:hypothetical protein
VSGRGGAAADLDLAIDDLLGDRDRPLRVETADLLATARLLRDSLPRYHPRFGFEEHLARRLAMAGRGEAGSALAAEGGDAEGVVRAPVSLRLAPVASVPEPPGARRRRGLLAGGAIASGVSLAIPIAGAAWVAWRRGRAAGGSL